MKDTIIAHITGIGWVTADSSGCGKNHDRFTLTRQVLPNIFRQAVFDMPDPSFRRMDAYCKLGLAAISLALKDARLHEWTEKRPIGIIASTEFGCLSTDMDYFDTVMAGKGLAASPALFSYTLPNSLLGVAAIRFGLTGINFVISESVPFGIAGLQMSLDVIASGETEKMLCGACDLGCPPSLNVSGHSPTGAIFFMLERSPPQNSFAYGPVGLDRQCRVRFGQTEIADLAMLVQACLKNDRS